MTTVLGVREADKILILENNKKKTKTDSLELEKDTRIYEYCSAANPVMSQVPVLVHPAELHLSG